MTDEVQNDHSRLIDVWFPCPEVDEAVKKPEGSGRSEKALFTWFASRPIAQARAAVLTTLLPDDETARRDIRQAVLYGDSDVMERLNRRVAGIYSEKPPVLLDLFSGRGIIPLEAARIGARSVATDLSPVATLAGRLLLDYPFRDWDEEPPLPFASDTDAEQELSMDSQTLDPSARLLRDVETVIEEVHRRVLSRTRDHYPTNPHNGDTIPWAYLWAVSIPCDRCQRRFPLLGSLVLRHPYTKTYGARYGRPSTVVDDGQSLRIHEKDGNLRISVVAGPPVQNPPFSAAPGKPGKLARCPYRDCGQTHSLDVVKAKGFAGQYQDQMIAVAELGNDGAKKVFRVPRADELEAAASVPRDLPDIHGLSAIPNEVIPPGNTNTIQASLYGYQTYGSLMNVRQSYLFATTAQTIAGLYDELTSIVSEDYATALAAYAAANLPRQIRRSTRGANLLSHGKKDGTRQNRCQIGDVFSSQSIIKHQFDYMEAGPDAGPGTWKSVSKSLLDALRKVMRDSPPGSRPGVVRRASATALPFRDSTVDVVVCDPPYYDMITYADSSDLFYVWIERALKRAMPDLFSGECSGGDGLQDKSDEIIVKSKGRKTEGEHRTTKFYESMLFRAFLEARRVLKADGRMTVIFGHSDPEAWKRLLTALTEAGFVVTSSWPSRTETAVTGVATISVTVSIGCLVAPTNRPIGIAAQVDAAVIDEVKARCRQWDVDGLALEDQQMAAYGAALSVVGLYEKVITPSGDEVTLEHYMTLALQAVRQSVAMRLDSLPLETFDALTRFAVFWMELYGRSDVPKGAAIFFAMSNELRIEDLRDRMVTESSKGFRIRYDALDEVSPKSSRFEVVRGMAAAWPQGTEAVAQVIEQADVGATDQYLWAVADWLSTKLPDSDPVSGALAAIKRNKPAIQAAVSNQGRVPGSES